MLKILRFYFKYLSFIMPNTASIIGTRIFYTPTKSKQSNSEILIEKLGREEFVETSQGKLKSIFWLSSDTKNKDFVLLAHGWGGRGTQLCKFVKPLLEHYNVITFDGPAHGLSPGKITTLPRYAHALSDICKHFKVSYVIAHSFGAGATAIAVAKHNVKLKKIVFIASPYSVENVVNNFCKHLKIPKSIVEKIHRRMETSNWHGVLRDKLAFSTLGSKIDAPVLMFHSRDDRYINYEDGKSACKFIKNSKFILLENLGHFRPIGDKSVIERSVEFLRR